MTIREKIELLKAEPTPNRDLVDYYYNLLETMDSMKYNYNEFMTTAPIDCDEELKRVVIADYDLCCALLTMLLREDHFAGYGCFDNRYKNGDVQKIIDRMIVLLQEKDAEVKRRLSGREAEYLMFMDD